jgi:HTH-type transcriptional regulator/antitoxin HigA
MRPNWAQVTITGAIRPIGRDVPNGRRYQSAIQRLSILEILCGDGLMDATMILIDSDAELTRARALVDRLWESNDPTDVARLEAQARLIAAYEDRKWPRRPTSIAELIRHLMDQHGLTRADMLPILGTPSRVSEILRGKKGLSMAMVQRLRAHRLKRRRFGDQTSGGMTATLA